MTADQQYNGTNGHTAKPVFQAPKPGCYVPAVTFFDAESDKLELNAQAKYYAYLASTGLTGLVILGTNAETFLLTRGERRALLECARAAVPQSCPIIAGVSGHSTAQVLEYISDAHAAGANYALVLPCAYFGKQTTPAVIRNFYAQVAQQSPLPIVLYNFPAVCGGVDMDSDLITDIANANPSIVGIKLTCGSVAKVARLAAVFPPERFAVFGGQSDFLLGALAVGGAGCIAAFANVFPRSVARLYELWKQDKQDEALQLQWKLALAESPTKAGVASTKYAAALMTAPRAGIKNAAELLKPRRPYVELAQCSKDRIRTTMEPISNLEDS